MAQQQTDLHPPRVDGSTGRAGVLRRRRRRQLNPRQRQGMLLVLVAAAGLIGVFLLIAGYVRNVSKQVGSKIQVLELTAPLQRYEPVSPSMLGYVTVPAKWAAPNVLRSADEAIGEVSQVNLPAGTQLEQGMLGTPPTLAAGQEEIAILVDAETGVAGQVTPGSEVSIVATYSGTNQSKNSAQVIVPAARVLGVGTPSSAGGSASGSSAATSQDVVVPVTFALSQQQVLAVSYAESFAQKVRLALIAPGTTTVTQPAPYTPTP
jgi:pilus assembly protein CpaB